MEIPSPRSTRRARIEIIPLIDIIFFLLATFVMVSLSMIKNQGIPVRLPAASSGAHQERQESVTISVTAEDEIFVNREAVALAQLAARLAAVKQTSAPEPTIFINGDEGARLGTALKVLDTVRLAGLTRVSFETKAPTAGDR